MFWSFTEIDRGIYMRKVLDGSDIGTEKVIIFGVSFSSLRIDWGIE